MSKSSAFAEQRRALTTALAEYDCLETDGANASALDAAEHHIYLASRALTTQVTPPGILALDQVFHAMVHSTTVIAIQLNIFEIVEEEMTIEELAGKTGCEELLLLRIMRTLASADIFTQPRRNCYAPTRFSRKFREKPARSWATASLMFMNTVCINLPDALAESGYRNPENPRQSAMTKAFDGKTTWEMIENDEKARLLFDAAMEQQDDLPPECIPDGDVDWIGMLGAVPKDEVAFVDVGGGSGHVMLKIIEETGGRIPGRFVLQDTKRAITALQVSQKPPFECMEVDFFKGQPLQGAKVYHIRRCLHDWSDSRCEQILRHIRDAMTPGYSRVLIHEFALPVVGAEQREVLFDILMMCLTGSERDEAQWDSLLIRSGLKIVKIWRAKIGHMAVIEAEAA